MHAVWARDGGVLPGDGGAAAVRERRGRRERHARGLGRAGAADRQRRADLRGGERLAAALPRGPAAGSAEALTFLYVDPGSCRDSCPRHLCRARRLAPRGVRSGPGVRRDGAHRVRT